MIRREYTPVRALGKLAQLAGEAEAAKRAQALAQQRYLARLQAEQQRQRLEFQAKLNLEAEQRARLWELEKMEIRSRNEFAMEEELWMKKQREKQAKLDKLDEYMSKGFFTNNEYKRIRTEIELGVKLPAPKKEDRLETLESDVEYYTNMMRGFRENFDIKKGWGKKVVPLAVVDKKGEPIREATPEEKALYDYSKKRLRQITPELAGLATPSTEAALAELELTETDMAKLQTLSEADRAEFGQIWKTGTPEAKAIALRRLRAS